MKRMQIGMEYLIPLLFLLFGSLWILLSDKLLFFFVKDARQLTQIQNYKGWAFVAISALLLLSMLKRNMARRRLMEAGLRENEERYRMLFESSLDAILLTAPDGRIRAANPAACRVFGYSEVELQEIGQTGIVCETEANFETTMEELTRSGRFRGELTFKHKDESCFTGEISSALYHDIEDRSCISMIIRDITERVMTEQQLRLQASALQTTANAVVILDPAWTILWINLAFEKMTGYSSNELLGKNPRILNSGLHEKEYYASFWDTVASGKGWHGEFINRRKDGTLYTEENTITPLLDRSGKITHYIAIKQDVTLRNQMAKELRESEERLRLALESGLHGMYDLNIQTGKVVVSGLYAAMLGYDPQSFEETIERFLADTHPDEREMLQKTYIDYLEGRSPKYQVEFRQKTVSGEWRWILSMGSIVERDAQDRPLRLVGSHTDITESKNAKLRLDWLFQESERRYRRLGALHEIDTAISSTNMLKTTLDVIANQVKAHLEVDALSILLYDDKHNFKSAALRGFHFPALDGTVVAFEASLAGKAAQRGELIHMRNGIESDIPIDLAALMKKEGFEDFYAIPLFAKGHLKGVLELFHRSVIYQDPEWLEFFEALAGQAAIAIENAQLFENLQSVNQDLTFAYDATIEGWSMAMDLRDKETEGHTQRVMEMTVALSRKMGIPEELITHIRRGALLHDIGKMGVPDSILLKPGTLTDEERSLMEKHPLFAYNMLRSVLYLRPALDIPHYHHEKWDGTGYPYGLKGDQIPLSARLFAIVDVYDALTSDRPYRKAWIKPEAMKYIEKQSGRYFDPEIMKIFKEYQIT